MRGRLHLSFSSEGVLSKGVAGICPMPGDTLFELLLACPVSFSSVGSVAQLTKRLNGFCRCRAISV
jgi:hypothetical protein